MCLAFCSLLLRLLLPCLFQELSSELAWLFGLSFWSRCQPNSPQKSSKNLWKINGFSFLLPFASFCFHACSKSYPRRWRGFSGSLFGAVVNPTRPTNHQKANGKSMFLDCCSMLLHVASMLVPRAILDAGVAFRALFLEPLSAQLAPKIINKPMENQWF